MTMRPMAHPARLYRVHGDALAPELVGHNLAHLLDGSLRAGVRGRADGGEVGHDAADDDDPTAAA